ncbi:asparagine synthase-related protein [Streptomyces sp. NPDC002402]
MPLSDADQYESRARGRTTRSLSLWEAAEATGRLVPDAQAVSDYLHYPLLPADPERSLLAGVRRIPGTASAYGRETGETGGHPGRRRTTGLTTLVDAIEHQVTASVRRAVRDRQRVAVLATGGVDSSLVAALVTSVTGTPPLLVSVRGGLCGAQEVALQDRLAEFLKAETLRLDHIREFSLDSVLRLNRGSDFPRGGVFTHVWDQACEAAREAGADVMLTGEGGDEIFAPGPALGRDLWRAGRPVHALMSLGRYRRTNGTGYVRGMWEQAGAQLLPTLIHPAGAQVSVAWRGRYADGHREAARRRRQQLRRLREAGASFHEAVSTVWLDRVDLHAAQDSTGRLTCVSPLAECAELVRMLRQVPPELVNPLRTGCQEKHLLRLVARRHLPAAISEQRKVGLVNQISVLLRNLSVREEADRLGPAARWLGVVLDENFHRPSALPAENGLDWTRLLALCAWAENAIERREPA